MDLSPSPSSPQIVANLAAKSDVWRHFRFPGTDNGTIATKNRAICCICHQDMPYKNNTSNLFSHLECHHKKEHQQLRKNVDSEHQVSSGLGRQPTITEGFGKVMPLGTGSVRHKQLVEAVGSLIGKDLKPISVVEGKGFLKLMKAAEPWFKVPSWTYFSQSVIPGKYIMIQQEVEAFLNTVKFLFNYY